jgi:alpha-amylase/alpha-mannosidase (GH57 family)
MPIPFRSVVIHGHFYQPPREDPWTDRVEAQPSAAPHHDWNTRIEQECYRAVVAARIPGEGGRIREIMNTLGFISFNFGPTLLNWMEKEAGETYRAILNADRFSQERNDGHGNAMAQAYHHSILPLASRRDKVAEVRWGMEDFRRRFGREPEGMWLPEAAVDNETLDVLAEEGIAFTVLAPHQIDPVPRFGLPGEYRTSGGRTITLFAYDGRLSHDVSFGSLLRDAEGWARRMAVEGKNRALVSLATDGENYGHHHRFGEMALAAVLKALGRRRNIRLENFASFLARVSGLEQVKLVEPSSWSCSHGVERWRADCGCGRVPEAETQQEWRVGLRRAMEFLAKQIHQRFEEEMRGLGLDPWQVRNDWGRVVAGREESEDFLHHALPSASKADRDRVSQLLELERNALRLFTSCGWFFDDLARVEPLQLLRYGAHALELMGDEGAGVRGRLLSLLEAAQSNEVPPRTGATLFREEEEARRLVDHWFPRRDSSDGSSPPVLPQLLEEALERAVEVLERAEEPAPGASETSLRERIQAVRELAFLHTHRRLPIPFDAQTRFYRLLESSSGPTRAILSTLREPLGFVVE